VFTRRLTGSAAVCVLHGTTICLNAAARRAAGPAYAPPKSPPKSATAPKPTSVPPCPPSSGILPLPFIYVPNAGFGHPNPSSSSTGQTPKRRTGRTPRGCRIHSPAFSTQCYGPRTENPPNPYICSTPPTPAASQHASQWKLLFFLALKFCSFFPYKFYTKSHITD